MSGRRTPWRAIAATTLAGVALSACSITPPPEGELASSQRLPRTETPSVNPDQPTGWGPTEGELQQAAESVAKMSDAELAGQVIVGRYNGTDPQVPARLVAQHHLAGIQITSSSVASREQLKATTKAVSQAVADDGRSWPAVIGVDQEGGVVSHLDGIATTFPSFATAGLAVEADPVDGPDVVKEAAGATAMELRDLGFTWVFSPVADVTIGAADPTIGTRSPSQDPEIAADTVAAATTGYRESGIVSTAKHFPGHGRATTDSHTGLPTIDASLRELRTKDLIPFNAAVAAETPAVMMAHLNVPALAPGAATSLSPRAYEFLRDELDFEGVAITDSLGMGAVVGTDRPAVTALAAGADLLLMPADTARAAMTVTEAITSGDLDRSRVEEAATRVVALQLWQQRMADKVPVPDPAVVAARAERAAAELTEAAY